MDDLHGDAAERHPGEPRTPVRRDARSGRGCTCRKVEQGCGDIRSVQNLATGFRGGFDSRRDCFEGRAFRAAAVAPESESDRRDQHLHELDPETEKSRPFGGHRNDRLGSRGPVERDEDPSIVEPVCRFPRVGVERGTHDEHRTIRLAENLLGNAAQHRLADPATPMSRHAHDGVQLPGREQNRLGGDPVVYDGRLGVNVSEFRGLLLEILVRLPQPVVPVRRHQHDRRFEAQRHTWAGATACCANWDPSRGTTIFLIMIRSSRNRLALGQGRRAHVP